MPSLRRQATSRRDDGLRWSFRPRRNGKVGLTVCCPITSHVKRYPFEGKVPPSLQVGGVVLSDQVKSLDWRARDVRFMGRLPTAATVEVLEKLETLLSPGEA